MGGLGVKIQHFPLTLLVVLTTLILPCERDTDPNMTDLLHRKHLQILVGIGVGYAKLSIFTVRRYALHGIYDSNFVCLSVCHTRGMCPRVRPTIMISSPYVSPIILVSGDITFIPKFEGGHPERGR